MKSGEPVILSDWDELVFQVFERVVAERDLINCEYLKNIVSRLMASMLGGTQCTDKNIIEFSDDFVIFLHKVECGLSVEQRFAFNSMLNNSLKSLAPYCKLPETNSIDYEILKSISLYLGEEGDNKILFKGGILKEHEEYLNNLFDEASNSTKKKRDKHQTSDAGSVGALSHLYSPIKSILDSIGISSLQKSYSSYIFYQSEGDYNSLHVDRDEYGINMLININPNSNRDSSLVIFDGKGLIDVQLGFGDVIVFRASSVIHGRRPIKKGDEITLLTVGFSH